MNKTPRIEIVMADITQMDVDAIVNAANTDLKLGNGVAGAIRKRGGPSVQDQCDKNGPIGLGEAAITGAGKLKAKYVIHAAGMHLSGTVNTESLRSATYNSLILASENGINTLAFPAIGTGVGNFPLDQCAKIMVNTVLDYLDREISTIKTVYFVLFDDNSYKTFNEFFNSRINIEY